MFNKVLVPLNDSEISPGILPYVSYLAGSLHMPVVLMLAVDPEAVESSQEVVTGDVGRHSMVSVTTGVTDEGRQFLRGFLEPLQREGIQAQGIVAVGEDPAREILQYASVHECDLIAMATRDRNLLSQAIKGSVTNEVLRSAHVPVLAVTPEKRGDSPGQPATISTILVPLDGSPFAEAVLPYVEHLSRKLSLEVVLVRVQQIQDVFPGPLGTPAAYDEGSARVYAMAEEAAEDEITRYLQKTAAGLAGKGINVRWELVRGDPAGSRIADLAREFPHNVIALASHGRSGISRWVMGSVAEDLLRATGDPVLIIPAGLVEKE
jgi:nucleotide-binding universal stress UspA family protein